MLYLKPVSTCKKPITTILVLIKHIYLDKKNHKIARIYLVYCYWCQSKVLFSSKIKLCIYFYLVLNLQTFYIFITILLNTLCVCKKINVNLFSLSLKSVSLS